MNTKNTRALSLQRSFELQEQANGLIAGFTQSMMKKPEQFSLGSFPVYLESGNGSRVKDVDGNEYIDFICGLAANTLGHNHPTVNHAIQSSLNNGILHSLPAPVEIKAARTLTKMIPGAEMVRFFKTGADANSAAIRLARHCTQKEEIVTVGYNGWHDQYMFDTPGVPKVLESLTHRMPLMHASQEQDILNLIKDRGSKVAALIISLPYNRVVEKEFLLELRELCSAQKVLFIWDEIVTGFRLALGGAQEFYGVSADLVTLSKGIAAGMPLSAVCGSKQLMSEMEKLQVSTTFGGEMLSLEVCSAVLDEYRKTDYVERIAYLGRRLRDSVNRISSNLQTPLKVVGYDPIPMFLFAAQPQEHIKLAIPFLAEMAKRGVLLRREVNFISAVHTDEDIDYCIEAVEESLKAMTGQELFQRRQEKPMEVSEV